MPERRNAPPSGLGFALPIHVDERGSIALSSGLANIDQSMRSILATVPGERVMRPDFGCAIWSAMGAPGDAADNGRLAQLVRDSIVSWEPRVEVGEVSVRPVGPGELAALVDPTTGEHVESTCVDVDIAFTERATATRAVAQFRLLTTREPAILVLLGDPADAVQHEWRSRPMLQRTVGGHA